MRSKHYQQRIKEDPETLLAKEKNIELARLKDRVRLLRLLKAGIVPNLKTAAEAVGISERQATRIWNIYKKRGLSGLLELKYSGKKSKLDKVTEELLIERLANKGFENLQEAKIFIEQNFGKSYTLPGVWTLMKRLKKQAVDATIGALPSIKPTEKKSNARKSAKPAKKANSRKTKPVKETKKQSKTVKSSTAERTNEKKKSKTRKKEE